MARPKLADQNSTEPLDDLTDICNMLEYIALEAVRLGEERLEHLARMGALEAANRVQSLRADVGRQVQH